jgi:hypothetical protein
LNSSAVYKKLQLRNQNTRTVREMFSQQTGMADKRAWEHELSEWKIVLSLSFVAKRKRQPRSGGFAKNPGGMSSAKRQRNRK